MTIYLSFNLFLKIVHVSDFRIFFSDLMKLCVVSLVIGGILLEVKMGKMHIKDEICA